MRRKIYNTYCTYEITSLMYKLFFNPKGKKRLKTCPEYQGIQIALKYMKWHFNFTYKREM
jgi:hypothetical protein